MRYYIGAQVDVSGLIDEGRGLDSFEKLLIEERSRDSLQPQDTTRKSLKELKELSQMFCLEEGAVVQNHSRSNSLREDASSTHRSIRGGREHSAKPARRVLGNDRDDEEDRNTWGLSSLSPSGKLPGVYQNVGFTKELTCSPRPLWQDAPVHELTASSTSSSGHILPSASSSYLLPSASQACSNLPSPHTSVVRPMSATASATHSVPALPSPQRFHGSPAADPTTTAANTAATVTTIVMTAKNAAAAKSTRPTLLTPTIPASTKEDGHAGYPAPRSSVLTTGSASGWS